MASSTYIHTRCVSRCIDKLRRYSSQCAKRKSDRDALVERATSGARWTSVESVRDALDKPSPSSSSWATASIHSVRCCAVLWPLSTVRGDARSTAHFAKCLRSAAYMLRRGDSAIYRESAGLYFAGHAGEPMDFREMDGDDFVEIFFNYIRFFMYKNATEIHL